LDATTIIETWLPGVFVAAGKKWEGGSPSVRLALSGESGGDWELQVVDGELSVEPIARAPGERREDPDIWIRMSAADFLAVLFPSEDLIEFLPPHKGVADLLSPESREMELLAKLDGRIKFELEGRKRRRWSIDAAFGPAGMRTGRPRTTVTIDAGTCEKLATRALNPLQALLGGRLRVDGDRGLAMQVLMLVATRVGG
jgi:hypothetical protein